MYYVFVRKPAALTTGDRFPSSLPRGCVHAYRKCQVYVISTRCMCKQHVTHFLFCFSARVFSPPPCHHVPKIVSRQNTDVPPDLRRHVLSFLVASPNTPDQNGNTALLAACENRGTPAVLDLLAAYGADTACTNNHGETALHVACRRGNAELAKYILDRESSARASAASAAAPSAASVSATDARGRRPGEVRDIDVGVHEAMAVRQVVGTECGRSM